MEFTLKTTIKATAESIYEAWLNSEGHSKMTGGEASINDVIGGKFTAWDGYIEGTNISLEKNKRIVQTWRTSDFEANEADSQLEIILNEQNGETELTLIHTNLSEKGDHFKQGWIEHYFEPMQAYFTKSA